MRILIAAGLFLMVSAFHSQSEWSQENRTFEENVIDADIVIIGRISPLLNSGGAVIEKDDRKTVEVIRYLKGSGDNLIRLRPAEIVHMRMNCCAYGTYIFALDVYPDGSIYGVDGPNSVYPID